MPVQVIKNKKIDVQIYICDKVKPISSVVSIKINYWLNYHKLLSSVIGLFFSKFTIHDNINKWYQNPGYY